MIGTSHSPDHINARNKKSAYFIVAIQAVLMVTVIILIVSSALCTKVKPCELQTALDFIFVKYTTYPCKYNAIKDMSSGILALGISMLCWIVLLFVQTIYVYFGKIEEKKRAIAKIVVIIGTFAFIIANLVLYIIFMREKETQHNEDYIQLGNDMFSSLKQNFKSDNASSNDSKSSAWNTFFLKYDCCAVHEVSGTTNDFDNTPWCTTSGSCQATVSQIPRTCCKGVTLTNYTSAPSTCHASVSPGTYKRNCMDPLKKMSADNIEEYQLSLLSFSLLFAIILQVIYVTMVIVLMFPRCNGSVNSSVNVN
uniref:Uncharacterized protein LOC111125394 n=1 Tax=Crassostrea virginica TaxID=6565 RepID=A0A8B8D9U4_CRAVI|nr:uncharacterized protein LOC111125394 [Crassostrea virginica]XP_022324867.1 uncharacterized protein LOC111125394 [Crassostrea virginica]XP_022324868.1 uncharacterized protein LOC111125394 [Crassostrea virginica]